MSSNSRLAWLDLARGLSALAVCIGHVRGAVLVDYASLPSSSIATKLVYAATGLGHQAVMVFFVLSGYFFGGSVLAQGRAFRWSSYARARLTRLWIVLIPALVMTLAVDQIIVAVAPETLAGAYYERWMSGPRDGDYSSSPLTFLGNLFFVQTILVPVFGTNGPLWSLANEACYYLVFPLLVFASGKGPEGSLAWRGAALLLASAVLYGVDRSIGIGFVIWLLGALVAQLTSHGRFRVPGWLALPGALLFGGVLGFDKLVGFQRFGVDPDLALGVAFALLLIALVRAPLPRLASTAFASFSAGISEISYSLYLFHYPFVILIGAGLYREAQLSPSPMSFLVILGWLCALVVGSIGFWWLFERRTLEARTFIERRIWPARRATSASPSP